ncbi:hypothetical protein RND81_05G112100 [Saponaria officinalis]|uniref:Transmembrane protein n=1 Tax=Saponaria officinalis TaxID=3572 RepID=A0AAW1KZU0_SAPOF
MGVMMDIDNVASKDGYIDYNGDIEKGELNVKLEGSFLNGCKITTTNDDGLGDGNVSIKDEERAVLSFDSSSDDSSESVRLVVVDKKVVDEKNSRDFGRKVVKEKPKAMSAKKKHPKPPRPPRGLSLDSTDQKLIKELHELARVKRARVERMKALKKAKESKPSSSLKNQLFATLLTVLFCLVLLLQGMSSRTSPSTSIRGTPFSSEIVRQHNILSVQQNPLSSAPNLHEPASKSQVHTEVTH